MDAGVRAPLVCLVASLLFFLLGHCAAIPTVATVAIQGVNGVSGGSWWSAMLPLWVGVGLSIFCEVLSVCYALPLLRRVFFIDTARRRTEQVRFKHGRSATAC